MGYPGRHVNILAREFTHPFLVTPVVCHGLGPGYVCSSYKVCSFCTQGWRSVAVSQLLFLVIPFKDSWQRIFIME